MNPHDLLKPEFLTPVWRSGALALLLWFLVWWREHPARSPLPLAAMAAAWAACHLFVSFHSNQFPPKQSEDWLVFGAAGVFLAALAAAWLKGRTVPVGCFSAIMLATVAWLAFRQMPYLLHREETAEQRHLWTAAGVGVVLLTFLFAEWVARKVSPAALFGGLAFFAALAGLSLWRMTSPVHIVARPLATSAVAAAGVFAALWRREFAAVPRGVAGWFAGGVLVLVIFGGLSRAANVPLWPLTAASGVVPAAAILVWIHSRLFLTGQGLTFMAAMLLGGSGLLHVSAEDQARLEADAPPADTTGADDTGAYD